MPSPRHSAAAKALPPSLRRGGGGGGSREANAGNERCGSRKEAGAEAEKRVQSARERRAGAEAAVDM